MTSTTAHGPFGLPRREWLRAFVTLKDEITKDNLTVLSAALAFYGMLALFPGLIALVSLYGLFLDPHQVAEQMRTLTDMLPPNAASLVSDQLRELVARSDGTLQLSLVLSLLGVLWSASSGVDSLIGGINLAYFERETRGLVKMRLIALATTVGLILFLIVAIAIVAVLPAVLSFIGIDPAIFTLFASTRWVVLAAMVMFGLALLYRYAPDRQHPPRWRWVSPGSILGTVLWLIGSFGFSFYVQRFGNYNETYGTLGAVIVLLLWLWLSAFSVLLGAEYNAILETKAGQIDPSKPGRERPSLAEAKGDAETGEFA